MRVIAQIDEDGIALLRSNSGVVLDSDGDLSVGTAYRGSRNDSEFDGFKVPFMDAGYGIVKDDDEKVAGDYVVATGFISKAVAAKDSKAEIRKALQRFSAADIKIGGEYTLATDVRLYEEGTVNTPTKATREFQKTTGSESLKENGFHSNPASGALTRFNIGYSPDEVGNLFKVTNIRQLKRSPARHMIVTIELQDESVVHFLICEDSDTSKFRNVTSENLVTTTKRYVDGLDLGGSADAPGDEDTPPKKMSALTWTLIIGGSVLGAALIGAGAYYVFRKPPTKPRGKKKK